MMRNHPIVLLSILCLALLVRLVGVNFGAPFVTHPDEHNLIYHAMEAGANGGNPGWFEYPSGMIYFSLFLEGARYLVSGSGSPSEFWSSFKENPLPFHLWVRVAVALFGVLGVYAVYLLGREWDERRESMRFLGWGSACVLAVHFLHVRDSHFATVDVPLTTGITFALWLLLREYHRPKTNIRRLLLVAAWMGVCCGIKYTAAPLVFPLLYVGYVNAVRSPKIEISGPWLIGSAALLVLAMGVGFLVTTPYAILDSKSFWHDVGYQWFTSRAHTPIYGGGQPFILGYVEGPWLWGGGKALGAFAFFGFMMAALRFEPEDRVLLAFAVPYFLLICFMSRVWGRWFLPLVPLQILWAVRFIAVYADHPWAESVADARGRKIIASGLVAFLALLNLAPTLRMDLLLTREDTRVLAKERMGETLDDQDVVLVTAPPYFCPPPPQGVPHIGENGLLKDRIQYEAGESYSLNMIPLDELVDDEHVNFVVHTSFYWDSVRQPFVEKDYPGAATYRAFLSDLKREGEVTWEILPGGSDLPFHAENVYAPTFNLWRRDRPGPAIRLYDVGGY